ncbi:MAG: hypothetical protein LBD13_08355 [Spirochaetaceae bacterium]|jgi:hypothetical protein|nr:hypothetical protein [Spirochaetaceae bacterium]
MNLGKIVCFLAALAVSSPLFALPDQKIIYPDESAYNDLAALALEQRIVFFQGAPLTVRRFKAMLAEIDEEALSPVGQAVYANLNAYLDSQGLLSFGVGALNFTVDPMLQPELYIRTNGNLPWLYNHSYRRPFMAIPVSLSFSPYFNAQFEAAFEQDRSAALKSGVTNFPTDNFSMTLPHRANLSVGIPLPKSSGIQFRIGIGEEVIGRTKLGSIILSDAMKDVTYAALSAYSPVFEYGTRILQIDVNKYFYLHTLEGRFFKRVSLAFIEGVMVNAPLELRFLNPLMVFHNLGAWNDYGDYKGEETDMQDLPEDARAGSFFAMKLEAQLFTCLRLYGIWALNELQTPEEKAREPEALRPDSFGFQAGAEAALPFRYGLLTFGAEGVYTYPFLYVLRDKRWSFYKPANGNSGPFQYWTGFPFGPDSIAAVIWSGYDAGTWSVSGSFLFLVQGERSGFGIFNTPDYHPALMKSSAAVNLRTPTGIPAYTYRLRMRGTWRVTPFLDLAMHTGFQIVSQRERFAKGFEAVFSARFIPRALWRLDTRWP